MSVDELEVAITKLSPGEMAKFSQWFDEYRADQWDLQIEQDIKAGRLNSLGEQADSDFEAGRCTPL